MIGWANNQAPITRPTQERKCACTTSKGTFIRSETNFCSCN
jgi:hypothetical protein